MPSLSAFLAPLVLLLPLGAAGLPGAASEPDVWREGPAIEAADKHGVSGSASELLKFTVPLEDQTANQVRIERRVILRISPRPSPARRSLMAELPQSPLNSRMAERSMGKCVDVAGIAGVQPDRGNRLMLFMRDRRIVAAELEKTCSARDFYSGFYIERSEDGRLCVDRDRLQSRAGAKCQVSRMRRLVAIDE